MVSCQETSSVPAKTSTVIIGNGPSALFLSFLLHGNVPHYDAHGRRAHPDRILDRKLKQYGDAPLYKALKDVSRLCEHFDASGRYSADAWPINALLDALLWPDSDLGLGAESTVSFEHDGRHVHDHVVLGSADQAGGQWAESLGQENGETAKTLSYSEQLSLPGYSFAEFFKDAYGRDIEDYERPRRPEVSAYYAAYPARVSICDSIWSGSRVNSVLREQDGSYTIHGSDSQAFSFTIACQHVVLACGLFTNLIEPPVMLSPYIGVRIPSPLRKALPILIIGSGFSAADAIVENLGRRPVIHLYKWQTAKYISPLKHCHRSSYPEYADVYKRMKMAAQVSARGAEYQGYADCEITGIREDRGSYVATITGPWLERPREISVGEITVLAGRRTSLDFFSRDILTSLNIESSEGWLEKSGLRDQITQVGPALTVDKGRILCIGSITGDSLIKFMFGGAMGAASHLYGI